MPRRIRSSGWWPPSSTSRGRPIEHEPELRAQLRLSLDPASKPEDRPLRTGRAIGWFEDALAPLRDRLTDAEFRRLVLAIRAGCGIEALIWLTDIAGLSREEAVATMTLVRADPRGVGDRAGLGDDSAVFALHALERERGQADGHVLARLERRVADALARAGQDRLAGRTSVCPPSCSTRSEPFEHDRVLVEVGRLERLLPVGGRAHVRDADRRRSAC